MVGCVFLFVFFKNFALRPRININAYSLWHFQSDKIMIMMMYESISGFGTMKTFPSIIDIFPLNWVLIKTEQQLRPSRWLRKKKSSAPRNRNVHEIDRNFIDQEIPWYEIDSSGKKLIFKIKKSRTKCNDDRAFFNRSCIHVYGLQNHVDTLNSFSFFPLFFLCVWGVLIIRFIDRLTL